MFLQPAKEPHGTECPHAKGHVKNESALCAGTLVVCFAEEVVGFPIGTLNYFVEDLVLLTAVEGSLGSDTCGETASLLDSLGIYL